MIIERIVSEDLREKANRRLDNFTFGNRGMSLFGSEHNRTKIGYIGEFMVMEYLEVENDEDDYEFDITYRGKKLEIKSISCKFKPYLHYLCTVNSYDLEGVHQQDADYYVFTRIINDMSIGWILGFIKCKEFFEKGQFVKKGSEVIPDVKFWKANATVLPINQLQPIHLIKEI